MRDRTIVDILRKGNQELFHSSMIAWLLDPRGEHGLGAAFLEAFADLVAAKGHPGMRSAVRDTPTPAITTESASQRSRYDIVIQLAGLRVVIENKTKSLGEQSQLDQYQREGTVLVALGFCDISFAPSILADPSIAFVTYAEILRIIDTLPAPPASDFQVLIQHYRRFLHRELGVFDAFDRWFFQGEPADPDPLVERASDRTSNDSRYLNLYLLERLRRTLDLDPVWRACGHAMDKNMQSGVWLAWFDLGVRTGGFRYADGLANLWKESGVNVWLQVELWDRPQPCDGGEVAGELKLRCATADQARVFQQFRQLRPLHPGERYPSRQSRGAKTCFLVARPLRKSHLRAAEFGPQLNAFAESFGAFQRDRAAS